MVLASDEDPDERKQAAAGERGDAWEEAISGVGFIGLGGRLDMRRGRQAWRERLLGSLWGMGWVHRRLRESRVGWVGSLTFPVGLAECCQH